MSKVISIISILVIALICYWVGKTSVFHGRKKLSVDEVVKIFGGGENVKIALCYIAKAYCVPVGLLRPDDVFTKEGRLWKYDQYLLGYGQEALNDLLEEHNVVSVPQSWTVKNFVDWYVKELP